MLDNQPPSCDALPKYNVFFFWTTKNNAPRVLREVDGYPIEFTNKEDAVQWISDHVDQNCNITYCITKSNEWDIKKLKDVNG